MSNEIVIPSGDQLPAYLQNYESDTTDSLVTGDRILPTISIKGKQFTFKRDGKEQKCKLGHVLQVVILGAAPAHGFSKSYYESSYTEGDAEAPDCSSKDGIKPDSWVTEPVCSTCAQCPKNEWKSAVNKEGESTNGKACSDIKTLLVLPANNPNEDIFAMRVPPDSLKEVSNYGRSLAGHKIPIEAVVTNVTFDEDAPHPKLKLAYSSFHPDADAPIFLERAQSDEVKEIMQSVHQVDKPAEPVKEKVPEPEERPRNEMEHLGPVPKLQLEDGSFSTDVDGTAFDIALHSQPKGKMGGTLTDDGHFRKTR